MVVTEGSNVRVVAMLINITGNNFQRFDDEFPVSTEDGTAIGMSSNTVQQVIFFVVRKNNVQKIMSSPM